MDALRSFASAVGATATAQRELVVFLWRDPRFRPVLIVIWVASFGNYPSNSDFPIEKCRESV